MSHYCSSIRMMVQIVFKCITLYNRHSRYWPKWVENIHSRKNLYVNTDSRFIHDLQKLGILDVNKQAAVQPHNGLLLRNKKEWTVDPCHSRDPSETHFSSKWSQTQRLHITFLRGNPEGSKSDQWWSGEEGAAQGALGCHGTTLYGTMVVNIQLYVFVKTYRSIHYKQWILL